MNLESVWRAFLGATQWPSNDPWRARGAVQSWEIVSTFSTRCLSVSEKKNIFSLIDRSAGCGFCGCAGCESCNKLHTRLYFRFSFRLLQSGSWLRHSPTISLQKPKALFRFHAEAWSPFTEIVRSQLITEEMTNFCTLSYLTCSYNLFAHWFW